MIRYPHTLEMWCEEEGTLNPDGSWTEGPHKWQVVSKCNARQNGQARQVKGLNVLFRGCDAGKYTTYPYRNKGAHLRWSRVQYIRPDTAHR